MASNSLDPMSSAHQAGTAAATPAGRLARTFRGITVRRFWIFLGVVAVTATGHALSNYLMPDKTSATAGKAFAWEYGYMFLFFGTVWIAVVAGGNWAPARTGPRIAVLVIAVAAGLLAASLLTHAFMTYWFPMRMDEPTLLKQLAGVVLWSHVVAAGVLGYFFLTREEEAVARLHQEEMHRVEQDRELAEARLQVHAGADRAAFPLQHARQRAPPLPDRSRGARRRCSRTSALPRARCCRACARPTPRSATSSRCRAYLQRAADPHGPAPAHPHRRARGAAAAAASADDAAHARRERDQARPRTRCRKAARYGSSRAATTAAADTGHRHRPRDLPRDRVAGVGPRQHPGPAVDALRGQRPPAARAEPGRAASVATIELPRPARATGACGMTRPHVRHARATGAIARRWILGAWRRLPPRSSPWRRSSGTVWGLANALGFVGLPTAVDVHRDGRPRTSSTNRCCRCWLLVLALALADAASPATPGRRLPYADRAVSAA